MTTTKKCKYNSKMQWQLFSQYMKQMVLKFKGPQNAGFSKFNKISQWGLNNNIYYLHKKVK